MPRRISQHVSETESGRICALTVRRLMAACVLSAAVTLPRAAHAQQQPTPPPASSYITAADIFVRSGPDETFAAVGRLTRGSLIVPLSRNEQSTWVMIRYGRGFGWIRSDLAAWVINIDDLPVIAEDNLTPTSPSTIPTPTYIPPTATPTVDHVVVGPEGGFVRSGPGREFPVLGFVVNGDPLEPVGRDPGTDWILIRYGDGFAWIARPLGGWISDLTQLPVLQRGALTPSRTFTATNTLTATSTFTPTATNTVTVTPSPSLTSTPSATATYTATVTVTPSPSLTNTPSATATHTATATVTPSPSLTNTPSATATYTATITVTPSPSLTNTPSATATHTATVTVTPSPSPTNTPSATATHTATVTVTPSLSLTSTPSATATHTATVTVTPSPSLTSTGSPTPRSDASIPGERTPVSTDVESATVTPSPSPTVTLTFTPTSVSAVPEQGPASTVAQEDVSSPSPSLPAELIISGILLALGAIYGALYWRGQMAADRYDSGFVINRCPICGGDIHVTINQKRVLGIPRVRTTVRCTNCRSILREVTPRHWRYAVDHNYSLTLYHRFNGKIIDEATLVALGEDAPPARASSIPRSDTPTADAPEFIDE